MRRAFARRDASFDGVFFVAVRTTGIFCRPVCRARAPRPENVEFFSSSADALYRGYRACKRCRPLDAGRAPLPLVARLIQAIERDPSQRLAARHLAALGIDASTARRQFKTYCGMSFAEYQRARRMGEALLHVRRGRSVVRAQIEAGYTSGSGFRRAFAQLFGTAPTRAADVPVLAARWIETPLGPMLAVSSDRGVCLCDFIDRRGLERAIERLRRATGAVIVPGEAPHLARLADELREYFAGTRSTFDVPLDVRTGTAFQRRAWAYLRSIPAGRTRSYGTQARALGDPGAARAVGSANGMNYLSILIPCHRVIAESGALVGYGGGLARKRWLLDHERQPSN